MPKEVPDKGGRVSQRRPAYNKSSVYVVQVGSESCAGDELIASMRLRETPRLCVPRHADEWLEPGDEDLFSGWLFLKPAYTLITETTQYVSVAILVGVPVAHDSSIHCDCHPEHDDLAMMQITFLEMRTFHPVRVAYTHWRGPYTLPVGDEATRLAAALDRGKPVESIEERIQRHNASRQVVKTKYDMDTYSTARVLLDVGKGTRAEDRKRATVIREEKHRLGHHFSTHRVRNVGVPEHVCCDTRKCSEVYRATEASHEGMDRLVWYRMWFRGHSQYKRRVILANRIRYVAHEESPLPQRVWLLESTMCMQKLLRANALPTMEILGQELIPVCSDFMCFVTGVSKNKLHQPTYQSPDFKVDLPRASQRRKTETPGKSFWITQWLINLAQFYLHDPTGDRIILPFADKRAVFDMYQHENEDPENRKQWAPYGVPSRAWFYKVWRQDPDARHVKTRKTLRFSLCSECVEFMNVRKHILTDIERAKINLAEGAHHYKVRSERKTYYQRRNQAVTDPESCFSIIIDGADQSAFGTPHHYMHSKADDGHWKIANHVMGALVHGRHCFGYNFLTNFKHGSNITIETLHRVLEYEFKHNNSLPFKQKSLYLQLDNTTKQCKSQYIMGYMALLVAWRMFQETMGSFLMVGHTHEDIDQMFSRIGVWLRKNNATSRIGFREAILRAFQGKWEGKVVAGDIESAANVSHFLDDYLAPMGATESREGITKFHQFKFSRLGELVIMRVREWSGNADAPWTGLTPGSTHHLVFKENKYPSPTDLATHCPPAQRGTKPTDPNYMDYNKDGEVIANHTSKTRKGVEALIKLRHVDAEGAADLHKCLGLLESTSDLHFHWNVDMYNVHIAHHAKNQLDPRGQPKQLRDDASEGSVSQDSNNDDDDWGKSDGDEPSERKTLDFSGVESASDEDNPLAYDAEHWRPTATFTINQVYLVRLEGISWGLARFVTPTPPQCNAATPCIYNRIHVGL